jgi:hypothetical protein
VYFREEKTVFFPCTEERFQVFEIRHLLLLEQQKELPYGCTKNVPKGSWVCWKNLYSGTLERFTTQFPSKLQRSPQVTSHVTHKI